MRRMVAPTVHFTVVKRPVVLRRAGFDRLDANRPHLDCASIDRSGRGFDPVNERREPSPVDDLLPWADPYIAMLAARLEAQGRLEGASR